jgi:hypothetical protein
VPEGPGERTPPAVSRRVRPSGLGEADSDFASLARLMDISDKRKLSGSWYKVSVVEVL